MLESCLQKNGGFFFLIGAFPLGPHSAVRKQRKTSQSAVSVEVGWLNTSDKHSGVLSGQLHCEGASKCISVLLTKTNVMYQYFFISIFNFNFFFKLFPVFLCHQKMITVAVWLQEVGDCMCQCRGLL